MPYDLDSSRDDLVALYQPNASATFSNLDRELSQPRYWNISMHRSRGGVRQQAYNPTFYDDRSRSRSRSRSPSRKSPPHDASRDRSRSSERSPSRGKPTREIMLDELASHVTEKDIEDELIQHYRVHQLEDVRLIRDRNTRQSRGFAFVRFATAEQAESFLDANYPFIYIYGDHPKGHVSQTAKVRISYGRDRTSNERGQETDWICRMCNINNFPTRARCFRCQTLKPEAPLVKTPNAGDNDVAPDNIPSQFLLFRGLEATTSEELFAKGVLKLNKPSSLHPQDGQPLVKKSKVVSTTGDANLGARDGSLRRILLVIDRKSGESWRYGFAEYGSIDDAQAALVRYNSFEKFTIASKQVLASYIHAGVFIPATEIKSSTERFFFTPLANPALKLAYWDQDAGISEFIVNTVDTPEVAVKPAAGNPADKAGLKPLQDVEKGKKRKVADSTASTTKKATATHLQFWSSRHAELHGPQPGSAPLTRKSYADPNRMCCYLCMRQFTTMTEIKKHERLSELHRSNLKDEARLRRAEHKMHKHNVARPSPSTYSDDTPEYRDRARERRRVYGVVNKKGEQVNETRSPAESDAQATFVPPGPSKGAGLLAKMGYTAGAGLGASGSGMTAPLTQDVYAAGVGLGAQGGKLGDAVEQAEKNTKGDYGSWVEESKDKARERYNKM